MTTYSRDVVVIGSGPNGMVAAAIWHHQTMERAGVFSKARERGLTQQ